MSNPSLEHLIDEEIRGAEQRAVALQRESGS